MCIFIIKTASFDKIWKVPKTFVAKIYIPPGKDERPHPAAGSPSDNILNNKFLLIFLLYFKLLNNSIKLHIF